jgi:hypothetical protein
MASADLLGQPDENALWASDVAEPIHIFVQDYVVDDLSAVFGESGERVVKVIDGEHDAQIAEGIYRRMPMVGNHWRREEA